MSFKNRVGSVGLSGALVSIACLSACSEGHDEPASESSVAAGRPSLDAAVAKLTSALPRTHASVLGSRVQRLYGVAATGNSARAAAENFRRNGAAALGVDADELVLANLDASTNQKAPRAVSANGLGLMYDRATGKYKFRLFNYEQQRDGIPVFRARLRALVRDSGDHPVVWANPDLRPMGTFRPPAGARVRSVDMDRSLQALRKNGALARHGIVPASLGNVSAPTLTIFAGVGNQDAAPRTAMQYTAEDSNGPGKWTFVADVETGDILHVESNLHYDISGTVRAEVVTGSESMECGTLGAVPLPHAELTSPAGNAFSDESGAFTVVQSGGGPVNLVSSVTGQFFDVSNSAGSTTSLSLSVTPPGPADFLHEDDATPPELVLAQLNAYEQVNAIRDLLLTHVPGYPTISTETDFPVNVNLTGLTCDQTGGAWYDNDSALRSINFCQRTAERANAAFGAIVFHEYGHHIVDSGGSGQNEYGEGMADTIAMLLAKDPRIGIGFHLNDCVEPLRHADRDCTYDATQCSSCGTGRYDCGALISGTVWDIWQELDVTEPVSSDDLVRSLVFSSVPLHTGTSIDPSLAVDFLTLDDDDELIENGTPHYAEICAGFGAHGMDCPPIVDGLVIKGGADLDSEGPSDGPFEPGSVSYTLHNLGPEDPLAYSVTTGANWLTLSGASGAIPLGETATITVSIDQAQAALLADGNYSALVNFVNESSGLGTASREAKLRVGAPVPIYTATFDDGAEGFTADTEPGNLWHRSTACVDSQPGHSTGGILYYGRDASCDYLTGVPILHTITSPVIGIANPTIAELGFNYYLQTEDDPFYDHAEVLVSVDGGPFQIVASNNHGGVKLNETTAWEEARVDIWDLLPATGPTSIRVQLSFNATDPNNNIKTGFAIDDLTVYAELQRCSTNTECDDALYCNGVEACVNQVCTPGTPPTCDDGNVCTDDACDEATDDCSYLPNQDSCADDGDECTFDYCDGGACVHPDSGFCAPTGAFVEQNGTVVIEAENFTDNTPRSAHHWDLISNSQASGQAVMRANPNLGQFINNDYATTSPELRYPVKFSTSGTYYVWIRGFGATANDDSVHAGIDGTAVASADRITGFGAGLTWSRTTMDGPSATLGVTQPGYRDINVWMREDGFSIDKIILTTNANFYPWGNGPGESVKESSSTQSPCAAYCSNPVIFTTTNYQSGNLGTGATCHETTAQLNGAVCGNFSSSRSLSVNGVQMPCNWSPWPSFPAAQNGGYCITTTGGDYPWAAFTTW
jgi:hypothetical protein